MRSRPLQNLIPVYGTLSNECFSNTMFGEKGDEGRNPLTGHELSPPRGPQALEKSKLQIVTGDMSALSESYRHRTSDGYVESAYGEDY